MGTLLAILGGKHKTSSFFCNPRVRFRVLADEWDIGKQKPLTPGIIMKHPIRYALTLAAFVGVGIHAENTPPGYVDFGKFSPPASGGEFVEVHITSNLISMVARLAEKNEPEIAELLRGLHRVRVNVIGLDDGNRAEMEARVKKIRSDLDAQGWERIVTAQKKDEDVGVYLKTRLLTSAATNASETCARLRLGIAFVLALLSVGLTGCFKVSSDVGALRDSVMKSAAAQWDEKIEIGVGPITLYLARAGLAFVDLDPEARTALHAVRGAEVGVYKLRAGHKELKRAVILSVADKAMARRGWDRIVGVMNQGEFVAIYVPHDARSTRNVRVCLLTLNGEEMVVASARSNLEPLMEMAFKRAEWRQKGRAPIHF